jgi:probable HAF family extracellular repeat protein
VGYSLIAGDAAYQATLWRSGAISDLGTLGGSSSFAWAINSGGQIVGDSDTARNVARHATLWQAGAPIDLNTLVDASGANWTLTRAFDINDAGLIVGYAQQLSDDPTRAGEIHAFVLMPVPIAPTWVLFGPALAALLIWRRRPLCVG